MKSFSTGIHLKKRTELDKCGEIKREQTKEMMMLRRVCDKSPRMGSVSCINCLYFDCRHCDHITLLASPSSLLGCTNSKSQWLWRWDGTHFTIRVFREKILWSRITQVSDNTPSNYCSGPGLPCFCPLLDVRKVEQRFSEAQHVSGGCRWTDKSAVYWRSSRFCYYCSGCTTGV